MNKNGNIFIYLLILLAIIGSGAFYYFYSVNLNSKKMQRPSSESGQYENQDKAENTSKNETKQIEDLNLGEKPAFVNKTKVLYYDENDDVILSDLTGNNKVTIFKKIGAFGGMTEPRISPNGKYLTFLALPEDIAKNLNENPPYEFHGSSDYILWMIDLQSYSKTKILDKFFSGLGDNPIVWDQNNNGFYYSIPGDSAPYLPIYFYYALEKETATKIAIGPGTSDQISPDNMFFVRGETKANPNKNTIDTLVYLNLYNADGTLVKNLYNSERYFEYNVKFITSNYVVLASKSYGVAGDLSQTTCYVELINVNTATSETLEKRPCFIPENPTGLLYPMLSPDGSTITALFHDRSRGAGASFTDAIFTYNLNTKAKSYIGNQEKGYVGYYFINPEEIFIHGYANSSNKSTYKAWLLNTKTGEITENKIFDNKEIITVL